MIEINRIIENEHVPLYFNDTLIGYLENDLEFLKARVDILNEGVYGYYLIFNGEKINIDKNGNLSSYPSGLFYKYLDLLTQLV